MRRPAVTALFAAAVVLATVPGCTRPTPAGAARTDRDAAQTYGYAPRAGGPVTYQPDVVLVGGGAAAIRSLSPDALTWTIDANAPHASDLAVGKVMFLTSRAVGRVLALRRSGGDLAVTLGPVDLGDVIRDGTIGVHQAIDPATMHPQEFPGLGGIADVTELSGSPFPSGSPTPHGDAGALSTAGLRLDPSGPPETGNGTTVTVGGFKVEISSGRTAAGTGHHDLKISYVKDGVIIGATFSVQYTGLKVDADVGMRDGKLTNGSHLRVSGIDGTSLTLESGSAQGLSRNVKARIEVPVEFDVPLPTEPVPLTVAIEFKFIVETAFSARDGTLTADGALALDGPAGFRYQDGYTVDRPLVTVTRRPVDTMAGTSVGVNAVVIAVQFKTTIGLGTAATMVGPFFALTESYGLTDGSAIGIVHCKQTSLDVVVSGGVGLTIDPEKEGGWLKKFLGPLSRFAPKIESDLANINVTVLHAPAWKPDLPVCRSS